MHTTLVPPALVSAHSRDPDWVILDCRFDLVDVAWGERQYQIGHIPGARYAHLDRDLSGPKQPDGRGGRHPLPEPEAFRRAMGQLGIGLGVQVVAYDQADGVWASRLWWLLRHYGHKAAAVLDGGWAAWQAAGLPTETTVPAPSLAVFTGSPQPQDVVAIEDVTRVARLIDARAPERFRGEVEPLDARAGHVPGAVNHFYKYNVDERGHWLAPVELRARLLAALGDHPATAAAVYCGSGVSACHNLLALEIAGLPGARLYPGSWSEWSALKPDA
jgi:thiosulfate/3-mercaptopyruvate sulfurtransferase